MSVASSVQKGDFDLDVISLRKPLEFPDGTIQNTAYSGDGSEDLAEVLGIGNDALGQDILGVGVLEVNTQIQLLPTGNTVNFAGEINQVALGASFAGNQMLPTIITSNAGQGSTPALIVSDNTLGDGLYVIPNAPNNASNPIVTAGDIAITSTTQAMAICCDSTTTNGVRITATTVDLGAGGNADTPTVNMSFNASPNQIVATAPSGMAVSGPSSANTATPALTASGGGNSIGLFPSIGAGSYGPFHTAGSMEILGIGTSPSVGTLELSTYNNTLSAGVRITPTYTLIGAGGASSDPTVRIEMNKTANLMELFYTNLQLQTGALPNAAGASSGLYLPVNINGVNYKIALLNA